MDVELDDWKKNVGFPINYNSGQSSDDDFDSQGVVMRNPRTARYMLADSGDGAEADLLGTTPPRSRIRDKEKRRNFLDSGLCLQRLIKEKNDVVDHYSAPDPAVTERLRKRASLKLIRAKERDYKLDIISHDKADSMPSPNPMPAVPTLVESCSRFMSLSSRPKSRPADSGPQAAPPDLPASRVSFHSTFSMLINMGNVDKGCRRTISREEQVWQNELKDLIWLEIQAKIAGRTLAQQDAYLCAQRKIVPTVINSILEYKFVNKDPCTRLLKRPAERQTSSEHSGTNEHPGSTSEPDDEDISFGCLTFECQSCAGAVGRALKEIGATLDAFFNCVALYPSSKAMTVDHPAIATPLFNDRLKAMCLWYNTALNMRLKMVSVGLLLKTIKMKSRQDQRQRLSVDSDVSRQSSESHQAAQVRFDLRPSRSPTDSSYDKGTDDSNKGSEDSHKSTDNNAEDIHNSPNPRKTEGILKNVSKFPESAKIPERSCTDTEESFKEDGEDEGDSGVESMRHTGQTTPEIILESQYSTDTGTSQENSQDCSLTSGPGMDPFDLGPLDELTQMRLLNKCSVSLYRYHHQEILKTQGVRRSMTFVSKLREHVLGKTYLTLVKPDCVIAESELEEPVEVFHDPKEDEEQCNAYEDESKMEELRRYGCWSPESRAMRLPSYRSHFLLLSSFCMEAMHDYLSFRLEATPDTPSCLTVKQLMHELKEGLDMASEMRINYVRNLRASLAGRSAGEAARDLLLLVQTFDATVETGLKLYLSYLTTMSEKEAMPRGALQAEWAFTARLARRIKCAHALAPVTFSTIVCNQLNRLLKLYNDKFNELKNDQQAINDTTRHGVYAICRAAQNIFASEREHTLQAAQWARALALRLARSHVYLPLRELIFNALMSVRDYIVHQVEFILKQSRQTLAEDVARDVHEPVVARVRELLLQTCKLAFEIHKELHGFVHEPPKAGGRRSVTSPIRARGRFVRSDSVIEDGDTNVFEDRMFENMAQIADHQAQGSIELLLSGYNPCDQSVSKSSEEDQVDFRAPPEVVERRLGEAAAAERLWAARVARAVIEFAKCWMRFVVERCDKGRGLRPRWASQGLEFLMLACDPCNTKHLTDEEFEELKQLMDGCISHVIGSRRAEAGAAPSPRPRHRLPSPFSTCPSAKESTSPLAPASPHGEEHTVNYNRPDSNAGHRERVMEAIGQLEANREHYLRTNRAVGRVVTGAPVSSYDMKFRQLTFKWQRGLKIGAGTFGKVYTVVNTESGQLLAMKELSIGAGDRRAFQRAANELRVLEGVVHPHLVRYYGAELHREEMLIFMELCVEGSLEALVGTAGALGEAAVRRYTRQLLSAVLALHARAIAHRDIKSGNIFLTNEGHCLKLGDFGCAVKIRANTTAPNELQGFVGTQAYMAPEVFMESSGHGRAADIWSVGCVVTEMASGKRPFSEYDSNYQIMFRVGMGGRPHIPPALSEEGRQFCRACLTHSAAARPRAHTLMLHTFLMVTSDDEDCKCEPAYLITKDGSKR